MQPPIFALATPPGRAAVAVVRMSGDGVGRTLAALAGGLPPPRRASLRRLRRPGSTDVLDEALALWFPAPHSFTGEDGAELHLHGGEAVTAAVMEALSAAGLRLAEPGEFTRRAFENGRLDLPQAEAIADLVDAETEAQRRQALDQLGGALSRRHAAWRAALVDALARLEAVLDFPDEDLPEHLLETVRQPLQALAEEFATASADLRGEQVRDGFRVALIGAPNAGKSTLLNGLARRDMAIVTEIPGTTRDVLEATLVLEGYRVVVADTAGVRDGAEQIEAEGVRRARAWAAAAALRLLVVDAASDVEDWRLAADLLRPDDVVLLNKTDLPSGRERANVRLWAEHRRLKALNTSAASVSELRTWLGGYVAARLTGAEATAATHLRHRKALAAAGENLERALAPAVAPELMVENIRLAARSLERISGRVDSEAVLDRVFAAFCIGK